MSQAKPTNRTAGSDTGLNEPWRLRLYIAGWTPASIEAMRNIKVLEAEYFPPGSKIEIIDLVKTPERGQEDHVLAIPTLVRLSPLPVRRIVGNLRDFSKTLKVLGFSEK